MYSQNNDNNCTCPHCGTDSLRVSEAWIKGMENGEPLLCPNCKKELGDNQTSGWLGSGKKDDSNFNISFFIIVFLLSGLLIYLNRTFDVLTFKEDSGQIVYEILLILIVSSALASGKIRQNLKYLAMQKSWVLKQMSFALTGSMKPRTELSVGVQPELTISE